MEERLLHNLSSPIQKIQTVAEAAEAIGKVMLGG
jgi:hypothetical protein